MPEPQNGDTFPITYKDQEYPCKRVEKPAGVFYAIKFNTRILMITKFDSRGELCWTAVPPDIKLNHIVRELGEKIDKHYQNQ